MGGQAMTNDAAAAMTRLFGNGGDDLLEGGAGTTFIRGGAAMGLDLRRWRRKTSSMAAWTMTGSGGGADRDRIVYRSGQGLDLIFGGEAGDDVDTVELIVRLATKICWSG